MFILLLIEMDRSAIDELSVNYHSGHAYKFGHHERYPCSLCARFHAFYGDVVLLVWLDW